MRSPPIDAREWKLRPVDQYSVKEAYRPDLLGILIPDHIIQDRVEQLAQEISQD